MGFERRPEKRPGKIEHLASMDRRRETLSFLKEDRIKLGTVSGVLTTTAALIEWVDKHIPEMELITTKSYQLRPNPGNREPIVVEEEVGCYGNAVGLTNPGLEHGCQDLLELRQRHPLRARLNISLSADCIDDFILLADRFQGLADLLELNLSCPHARGRYGAAIGSDPRVVAEFIREIRATTSALLFPKLTPNVEALGRIALAAMEAGADGLAAINTVGPVEFREPHTGRPVLYNPLGHRGGKSGQWIREIALTKVREIRKAVGPAVPIIGMGGVTSGPDVVSMREAGADLVGLGSAFIRVPRQAMFPKYVAAVKEDARGGTNRAARWLSSERVAAYTPYPILEIEEISETLRVFRLGGKIDYRAGQFVFLFLPGAGEKPFSIAGADPLTFIIRKRGEFTQAAFGLRPGDTLLIRGPYGAPIPVSPQSKAYVVAAGTGVAVAPALVRELLDQGKEVTVYCGTTTRQELSMARLIGTAVPVIPVDDQGRRGRVLQVLEEDLSALEVGECCFYTIGPAPFLHKAGDLQQGLGARAEQIFLCLEPETRCGIGACGSCECGGRLLCKEGTFLPLSYLKSQQLNWGGTGPPVDWPSSQLVGNRPPPG